MSKTSYGTTYVVQDYSRMAGEIQIINDEGKLWWAFHTRFKLEGVSSPSSTEGWDVP
jgi:hypothetical protein